jgi:adenine deaminase
LRQAQWQRLRRHLPGVVRVAPDAAVRETGVFDAVVRNGRIVDGTGAPWFPADVGLRGGRIAAVGNLAGALAALEVDATGMTVAALRAGALTGARPGWVLCPA